MIGYYLGQKYKIFTLLMGEGLCTVQMNDGVQNFMKESAR